MRTTLWPGLILIAGLLLSVASCGLDTGGAGATATAAARPVGTAAAGLGTAVAPAATALATINLTIPESGTPAQQVQQLWDATRPILKADASLQLSDAEIQARRIALSTPWAALQARWSGGNRTKEAEAATQAITDILALVNNLYGDEATRKATGPMKPDQIEGQLTTIDQKVKALP
jgi:hypothetical protein